MAAKVTALNTRRAVEQDEAEAIVQGARRRALGARPALRRVAGVLWSGFLGAVVIIDLLALAPDGWDLPPLDDSRVAVSFGLAWLLCLIPAIAASLLAAPPWKHSASKSEDAR
jgi:hypothetical protein